MLSPVDLLEQAEAFASRIPGGREYEEDRNSSWLWIGEAWLKLNDGDAALRALAGVDHPRCDAVLRHAVAMWTGDHLSFAAGADVLRAIAPHLPHLTHREITDLTRPLFRLGGEQAVLRYASVIPDAFSAGGVLVTLSHFLNEREGRRHALEAAERLAEDDFALSSVYNGYRTAGMEADAQRVRERMQSPPERLDDPFLAAESVLAKAAALLAKIEPDTPPDTPIARLRRILDYKFADLKIRFLLDSALAGGIADSDVEAVLFSDAFGAITGPRAPSIYRDPSGWDLDAFADFFFARPVAADERDRELLEGLDHFGDEPRRAHLQPRANELFRHFGRIARRYSAEQIDQGLWLLIGGRFQVPDFDETMYFPFADYYAATDESYIGSAFYMWWDLIRPEAPGHAILQKILALPSAACQRAALHGLNHMRPDPQASAIVSRYIEENRAKLTPEELEYAELCRDGRAQ